MNQFTTSDFLYSSQGSTATHSNNLNALIVDDQELNRFVEGELLQSFGLTVELRCDGSTALSALSEKKYDIVLLDMELQDTNGIEIARKIRTDSANSEIFLFAVTGHGGKQEREKCVSAGMNGFITKPLKIETVEKMLTYVFKNRGIAGEKKFFEG